jgi:hypothetical protein
MYSKMSASLCESCRRDVHFVFMLERGTSRSPHREEFLEHLVRFIISGGQNGD